jgi:hypothetical protein
MTKNDKNNNFRHFRPILCSKSIKMTKTTKNDKKNDDFDEKSIFAWKMLKNH